MPEPEALAEVADLAERLPFVMSTDEEREATGALEDLSDEARHFGSDAWLDPDTCPREVKNLVLKAAGRHMKNYDGYTSSAAGDERVAWSDRGSNPDEDGSATFSPTERTRLSDLAGNRQPDFQSVGMFAYQRKRHHRRYRDDDCLPDGEGYVPDSGGGVFPMFCDDESPW